MSTQAVKTPPIVHLEPYQIDEMSSKCTAVAFAILTLIVAGAVATLMAFTGGPANPMIFGPGVAVITVSLVVVLALLVRVLEPAHRGKPQNVENRSEEFSFLQQSKSLPPGFGSKKDPRSPTRISDPSTAVRPAQKKIARLNSPQPSHKDFFAQHHLAFSPSATTFTPGIEPIEITAEAISDWNDEQVLAYLRDIDLSPQLHHSFLALIEKLSVLIPPDICKRFAAAPKIYLALAEKSVDAAAVLYEVMKWLSPRKRKELISQTKSDTLRERMVNYQMFVDWERKDSDQPRFVERLKQMKNLNCFRDYLAYFDAHHEPGVPLASPKKLTLRALASPSLNEKFAELDELETFSLSPNFSLLLRYQQCIRSFEEENEFGCLLLMTRFLDLDEDKNLAMTLKGMEVKQLKNYIRFIDLRYFSGIDKTRDQAFEHILKAIAEVEFENWPHMTTPFYAQLLIRLFETGNYRRDEMEPLLKKCEEEVQFRILETLSDNIFYRYLKISEPGLYDFQEDALNHFRDLYPMEQVLLLSRLEAKYIESLSYTKRSHIHENTAYACIKKIILLQPHTQELLTCIAKKWPQLVAKYMVEEWDPEITSVIDTIWNAMDAKAKQRFQSSLFECTQTRGTIPEDLMTYTFKFTA